jgi:hypothetical protein
MRPWRVLVRRSFGLATLLVALSLAFPLAASAGPPGDRVPPGTVIQDLPAGMVCPAATGEVTWTIVDGQYSVVAKPDGRVMQVLGASDLMVTSVATGKSVVLKAAGMTSISSAGPDALVARSSGLTVWGFFPGDAGPGVQTAGRTYYFVGTSTALLGLPDWTGLTFSYSGKILMDVCAAIS